MDRPPGGWRLVLGLAALLGAAVPARGDVRGIYRPSEYGFTGPKGCILPTNVPRFDALAFDSPTPEHAESLATRLGFAWKVSGERHPRVTVTLGASGSGLVWHDARHDGDADLREAVMPVPLEGRAFKPPDPVLPLGLGRVPPGDAAPQPNGVTRIAYVIALVRRIDVTSERWPPANTESGGGVPLLDFRNAYRIPELSAVASDARGGGWGGRVRLLEPYGTGGPANEWLTRRGPGWIGVGFDCADLAVAMAWFDAHQVRYTHDRVAGRNTLRLDPAATDGWLVELVGPVDTPTP